MNVIEGDQRPSTMFVPAVTLGLAWSTPDFQADVQMSRPPSPP